MATEQVICTMGAAPAVAVFNSRAFKRARPINVGGKSLYADDSGLVSVIRPRQALYKAMAFP